MENFGFRRPPQDKSIDPSGESWLHGKSVADQTESYWRIHEFYYDLTDFVDKHPGGSQWIEMTRGHDITELFESHHPNIERARRLLKSYESRNCKPKYPRNSDSFTFKPGDFYDTLRGRCWEVLQVTGSGPTFTMLAFHSLLLISYLTILFSSVTLFSIGNSWIISSTMAGITLGALTMCSHNFFHQRDCWRRYCFDLSPFSSYEWRITHCYSHHTFPNTTYDAEMSIPKNIINFFPTGGKPTATFVRVFGLQFGFALAMVGSWFRRIGLIRNGSMKFRMEYLVPLWTLLSLVVLKYCSTSSNDKSLVIPSSLQSIDGLKQCIWSLVGQPVGVLFTTYAVASFVFLSVSLAAAHHHPDVWHDGDKMPSKTIDWGLFQLCAVGERGWLDESNHLAALCISSVSFGRHTLHHLFPTVDHSKLHLLIPALRLTCQEFNVNFFPPPPPPSWWGETPLTHRTSEPNIPLRQFSIFAAWQGMWNQLQRSRPSERNYITWAVKPKITSAEQPVN